jgi:hypothetical protein
MHDSQTGVIWAGGIDSALTTVLAADTASAMFSALGSISLLETSLVEWRQANTDYVHSGRPYIIDQMSDNFVGYVVDYDYS